MPFADWFAGCVEDAPSVHTTYAVTSLLAAPNVAGNEKKKTQSSPLDLQWVDVLGVSASTWRVDSAAGIEEVGPTCAGRIA